MNKQFIFIMTDTTRKDMLGCYGNDKMITPNLDKLASEGIMFNNAYTCQPVCGPARSAIFTGQFPHSNGMVTNSIALGDNIKTLGQRLTDNGVHCGYIGKWHLDGSDYFGLGRCPEGWDPKYWYDMKCYLEELTPEERVISRKPDTCEDPNLTEEFTYAYRCTTRAIDFIDENCNEDFFLTLSYDEPHGPSVCPAPFNHMYDGFTWDANPTFSDTLENKPFTEKLWSGDRINQTEEELNKPSKNLSRFLGSNSFVDYQVGKLMEVINEKAPNAIIVFTSDHGDMLGSHKLNNKNATCYKETANIPFIVRGGEKGKVVDYVTSHIDVVPTVLEYFNVKLPKLLEGKSMLSQIYDTSIEINDCVFTEFTRYEVDHDGFGGFQPMRAATTTDYKLVMYLLDTDAFYDLKNDPYEMNNLINDPAYAKQRNELHDKLLENMNVTRDFFRGYQWAVRPWRNDKTPDWENDGYTRQRENEEYEPRQLDYDTGLPMADATRNKNLGNVK
ncbi:MAG: sulfatase-like hydrolase/transferase [Clostridia bacterium]